MNFLRRQLSFCTFRKAHFATCLSSRSYTNRQHRALQPRQCKGTRNSIIYNTSKIFSIGSVINTRFYRNAPAHGEQMEEAVASENASDEEVSEFFREHQIFVQGLKDPEIEKPIFNFLNLKLPPKLQAIMDKLNFAKPTPIQSQSLPILFSGRDLIGIAQTGSGKTLAYLLPALNKFFDIHTNYYSNYETAEFSRLNPKVLILAPTRELALQIFDVVRQFRIFKTICLYGGSDRKKQVYFLQNNSPLIVVSTPGRLKDLVDDECLSLQDIEYLVVDEADRMLDMGFEPQIAYLIEKCPQDRQTMMFSATWPDEVKSLVHKYLHSNHAFLSIGGTKLVANHNIVQNILVCLFSERIDKLAEILKQHRNEKVLIFANTKIGCSKVASLIQGRHRIRASALHGDMTQNQREQTLKAFKMGQLQVLCATNVAARGLDIEDVNVVVNYDLPDDVETYVHRIGRTGRMKNKGYAYSFFIDETKTQLAAGLIEILKESNNEIPNELQQIARNRKNIKHRNTDYNRQSGKNNWQMNNQYRSNRRQYDY